MGIRTWWWARKLENGTPEERELAARKLGEMSHLIILVPELDKESEARAKVAYALGDIGGKSAIEQLVKMLGDGNANVRFYVAEALGKTGNWRAVEPLIRMLGDKDENVLSHAAQALGKIGEPAVEPLIEFLKKSLKEGGVTFGALWSAVEALGKIGKPAVEPLIEALGDENSEVRKYAAQALGKIGDKRAVGPLIKALVDDEPDVSAYAAQALGLIKDVRAAAPLMRLLGNERGRAREYAETALKAIGPSAIGPAIKVLEKGNTYARKGAVAVLSYYAGMAVEALPALHKLALRDPEIREEVKDAIAEIASGAKRPSGVREIPDWPKDVTIERMFRRMASDVRQQKMVRV